MKKSSKKFKFWLTVGLLHLGISSVGCFFGEKFPDLLAVYGFYTGSVSKLSFFAPGVGSQLRVLYHGIKPNGVIASGSLLSGRGETDLRIEKMIAMFWRNNVKDDLRRSLAASWAGKILAKNPDFSAVSIAIDSYDLPSMTLTREGREPKWIPYYYATFTKPEGI